MWFPSIGQHWTRLNQTWLNLTFPICDQWFLQTVVKLYKMIFVCTIIAKINLKSL